VVVQHYSFGDSYKAMQRFLPGRSVMQIREQWRDRLCPQLKVDVWSDAEDRALFFAVQRYVCMSYGSVCRVVVVT
jgi:hypothetical protein